MTTKRQPRRIYEFPDPPRDPRQWDSWWRTVREKLQQMADEIERLKDDIQRSSSSQ